MNLDGVEPDADERSRIRCLFDKEEIREVLARYARAADTLDWDAMRATFWPDALLDYGFGAPTDIDTFIENGRGPLSSEIATDHFLGQSVIELEGDVAWVEAALLVRHRHPATDNRPQSDTFGLARICDRFERRGGRWRSAHRVLVYQPGRTDAVVTDMPLLPGQRAGVREHCSGGLLKPGKS